MYNEFFKNLEKSMNLKKDSKLAVYVNEDLDFIFEIKNLNNISGQLFLLLLLDNLINEHFIDKKTLLDMINKIL